MKQHISLWPYATANFFYYGFIGGFISFLVIFLSERGFNSVDIGQVFAIYTITRVGVGQVLAHMSDKQQKPRLFFQIGILLTLFFLLPQFFTQDKTLTFIFSVASLTFFMSVVSQLEVLSLLASKDSPKTYNRVRLFGSVGFIVAAIAVGGLIDTFGSVFILYFAAVYLSLVLLISVLMKNQFERSTINESIEDDFFERCKTLGFISFLSASILLQMSFAPFLAFFTKYLADIGYQGISIGVLFSLGTFSEIFIFMVAGAILARFNIKFLLWVCLLLTAIRWIAQGYYADVWYLVVITQLVHAFSFGLIHSTSIHFIRQYFTKCQQNRGQFMYVGVTFGVGGAIGAWLTGMTWQDGAGSTDTFLWAAACAFIGAVIIFVTPSRSFNYRPHKHSI